MPASNDPRVRVEVKKQRVRFAQRALAFQIPRYI